MAQTDQPFGAPPPSTLEPGAVVAGRYRIVGVLGSGGMGTVYRAVQEPLGREVALKVVSPALATDAESVERFRREAKAASSLAHPHIVTVFDFGTDGATLFLAMELIAGEGLDAVVRRGPMAPARAIPILRGICSALAEAHARGIIHRDLKPQNVMLASTSTQNDVVKVVDFGIARVADGNPTLTRTGAVVGTPGYVAPELFDGAAPSPSSDLYALGVVAYELLCGTPPFPGVTPREILKAVLFGEPLPLRNFAKDVPERLEALVLSLLQKDPSRRPDSAVAVDQALATMPASSSPTLPPLPPLPLASPGSPSTRVMGLPSGLPSGATPATGVLLTEAMAPPPMDGPARPRAPLAPVPPPPGPPPRSMSAGMIAFAVVGVASVFAISGVMAMFDDDADPASVVVTVRDGDAPPPEEAAVAAKLQTLFGDPGAGAALGMPQSAPDALFSNAAAAMRNHMPQAAEPMLLRLLEDRPDDVEAILMLSNVYAQTGRPREARIVRQEFIELAPDHPKAPQVRQYLDQRLDDVTVK